MKTSTLSPKTVFLPSNNQVLFSNNGFTAEVCRTRESLETAFRLRYRAYRAADAIEDNEEEMLYDDFDFMPNTFVHLVWYEGKPVATVRSCIYSDEYNWERTEGVNYFPEEVAEKLGTNARLLESNRYAVDPDFKGRKSLFAQMLMFRIHALCSAVHGCSHIITSVRKKHVPFYQRFLGFDQVSSDQKKVEWVDAEVVLLAVPREKSYEVALKRGVPEISQEDVSHYAICAGVYRTETRKAA